MKQRRRDGNFRNPTVREGAISDAWRSGCTLPDGRVSASSPKTRNNPFVNFACDPHVVQVVFADLRKFARLIEVKYLAAFDFRCLARFKSKRPGHVVEPHALASAQPPAAHRVEYAAHVVFAEIHKWVGRNVVHQTALKDERQIESDDVVADDFVAFDIEIRHQT